MFQDFVSVPLPYAVAALGISSGGGGRSKWLSLHRDLIVL